MGSERRRFHQHIGTLSDDANLDAHSRQRQKGPERANQTGSVCSDRSLWKRGLVFVVAEPPLPTDLPLWHCGQAGALPESLGQLCYQLTIGY